jgi:exosortase A
MNFMDKQSNRKFVALLSVTLALWVLFFWQGIVTAFDIWWGNEIFNHCLFVVPTSAYLIYQKRNQVLNCTIKPTLLPLACIVPLCFLYVVGQVGDIQLFMHVAVFTILPLLIWSLLGHEASKVIIFPLFFILFAIPIGEQLIPHLQEVTADGSVALLKAVGIPLYRSGLYIEIPAGRFLVAEACSGVSFFIVSIVIGSLFSYLSFVSVKKKLTFVTISVFLPVLANVIRVFGIIYIAHKTDMEYAAGADHLIYGWFFFAFVIVCLLGIGELMRDKNMSVDTAQNANESQTTDISLKKPTAIFSVLFLFGLWGTSYSLGEPESARIAFSQKEIQSLFECNKHNVGWQPVIEDAGTVSRKHYLLGDICQAVLIQANYYSQDSELVSGLTLLYSEKEWSLENTKSERVQIGDQQVTVSFMYLTSPTEQKVKVTKWYEVNNRVFTSNIKAKLYVTFLKMTRQYNGGRLLMLAMPQEANILEFQITEYYE